MKRGLGLWVLLIFVCVSCSVIKVSAEGNTNTYGNDNYTITVPSVVSMTDSQKSTSFDIQYDLKQYVNVDVKITSEHDHKLFCGNQSLSYSLTDTDIVLSSATNKDKESKYSIGIQIEDEAIVSGTYTDTLTFTLTDKSYSAENQKHKLTFDLNANNDSSVVISTTEKNVTEGLEYGLLPIPTRDGYKFDGWFTDKSGGTGVSEKTFMGESDTTVYAHWTPYTLTINYYNDGAQTWKSYAYNTEYAVGSGDLLETETVAYNGSYKHSQYGILDVAGRLNRKGYHSEAPNGTWKLGSKDSTVHISAYDWSDFKTGGVFEGQEATGMYVADKLGVLDELKKDNITVNLYPVWIANTYTISYDANCQGATGGTESSSHTYDVDQNLTLNGYVREGYEFNGWNTKTDGTGTAYSDGESVRNLTPYNGKIITLYAQWEKISAENDSQNEDFSDGMQDGIDDSSDDALNETNLNEVAETSDVELPVSRDEETVD